MFIIFCILAVIVVGGISAILWILREVDNTMKKVRP